MLRKLLIICATLLIFGSAEAGHLEEILERGTNEKFAQANLKNAILIVFNENADIMITEKVEALAYLKAKPNLAAPLIDKPFTRYSCGRRATGNF